MPSNTILDIALSNPDINGDTNGDFNILGTALGLFPNLVSAAGEPGASLTVFAPTDQAFLNLQTPWIQVLAAMKTKRFQHS